MCNKVAISFDGGQKYLMTWVTRIADDHKGIDVIRPMIDEGRAEGIQAAMLIILKKDYNSHTITPVLCPATTNSLKRGQLTISCS